MMGHLVPLYFFLFSLAIMQKIYKVLLKIKYKKKAYFKLHYFSKRNHFKILTSLLKPQPISST